MLGDYQLPVGESQQLAERPHHAGVAGHATLECNGARDLLSPGEVALHVAGHGETEACRDIGNGRGNLLEVDHVALGKDTAPPGDPRRAVRLQGKLPELSLDGKPHPLCLLIEKRAGARGADAVQGKVLEAAAAGVAPSRRFLQAGDPGSFAVGLREHDELRVFASHLDDRAHVRVQGRDGSALGYDFIDKVTANQLGRPSPARSRKADESDMAVSVTPEQGAEQALELMERPPAAPGVAVLDDSKALVHHDRIDRDASDVYSQVDSFHGSSLNQSSSRLSRVHSIPDNS